MKRTYFVIVILLGWVVTSTAQKPSLELTFSAIDNTTNIQLDSIKVMNLTQGGDTVLNYPDTILTLNYVLGIEEVNTITDRLRVFQNYPNPVVENTTISIYIPEKGLARCLITDIMGRMVYQYEEVLESGVHSFSYTPGGGEMSFFTAIYGNSRETVKIMHPNSSRTASSQLSYIGESHTPLPPMYTLKGMQGFNFNLGDDLVYIGFADGLESGVMDTPSENEAFYLQFASNIPCPGIPTVTYEGRVYNTVLIYNQCWLKENLNVGVRIPGSQGMTNNGIIEKYCYNNVEDSCSVYGGLYCWDEVMQYTNLESTQGICPNGWHIPTDADFKVLEGTADSQYGVGNPEWDKSLTRGYDAGINLKSTSKWRFNGNGYDIYGFSALPAGMRGYDYYFGYVGTDEFFWVSTEFDIDKAWSREFSINPDGVRRFSYLKNNCFSVRCIRN